MAAVRGIEERIRWFDHNRPERTGLCARFTWQSFGGLPAWGAPDANAVVAKAKAAGVLHTDANPPRGAIVLWTSHNHGHMALSLGGGQIISTDYPHARDTGEAPLSMPRVKWGHRYAGWLDTYAGVKFDVGHAHLPASHPVQREAAVSGDGYLSLKGTQITKFRTNHDVRLDIGGRTQWDAEQPSEPQLVAGYWNIDLPPGGSPERKAICNGGVRTWFTQMPGNDITGLDGPWAPALWGEAHLLISRVWPHKVQRDKPHWVLMMRVYAYDDHGKPVDIELELETREAKLIAIE